jgi:hypothetical protein
MFQAIRDEAPFAAYLIEPAQQELTEAHHLIPNTGSWVFAQRIEPFACWRPQPIGHGLGRRWVARRRWRRGKPLAQGLMVWLTAERNQRRDVRGRAERHIGLAEIAVVGQQCLGPAEVFPQDIDLLKHRRDLTRNGNAADQINLTDED